MFHAIGYELIDDKLHYYAYTCRFLYERIEINASMYEDAKKVFNIAGAKNKFLSGVYYRANT